MTFYVLEGEHTDPNKKETMLMGTATRHGPYNTVAEANAKAIELIQKNVDNYYHRAWVLNERPRDPWDDWSPTVQGVDL